MKRWQVLFSRLFATVSYCLLSYCFGSPICSICQKRSKWYSRRWRLALLPGNVVAQLCMSRVGAWSSGKVSWNWNDLLNCMLILVVKYSAKSLCIKHGDVRIHFGLPLVEGPVKPCLLGTKLQQKKLYYVPTQKCKLHKNVSSQSTQWPPIPCRHGIDAQQSGYLEDLQCAGWRFHRTQAKIVLSESSSQYLTP